MAGRLAGWLGCGGAAICDMHSPLPVEPASGLSLLAAPPPHTSHTPPPAPPCHQQACALKTNGSLYCWGYGGFGNLGNNATDDKAVPTRVADGGATWTALPPHYGGVGHEFVCAIQTGGTVWCWGWAYEGEMGNGSIDQQQVPVQVSGAGRYATLATGGSHACAVRVTTGTMDCWVSHEAMQGMRHAAAAGRALGEPTPPI